MGPLEERLISQLHRSVWEDVRIGRQTLVQYIAVLVSVLAVMGWGLKGACPNYTCSGPCPDRLLLATLVSQGALLWILFITIESAYQYRVSQAISSAIERNHASEVFPKEASCACKRILPPGYYLFPPKFNLPELFQINFWAFYALFLSLPLIEAYFIRHAPHCRLTVVIAALLDILGLSLVAIQKFCKTFSGCCSKSCGSQEDALIALAVFAPFFVPVYFALRPDGFLSAVSCLGSLLLLCFYCARKSKFTEDFITATSNGGTRPGSSSILC